MCYNKLNHLQHQASLQEVAEQCFQDSPDTRARSASAFRANHHQLFIFNSMAMVVVTLKSDSHDTLNQPASTHLSASLVTAANAWVLCSG